MLKIFPTLPDEPIPRTNKSPVAVVVEVGDQSIFISDTVDKAVDVEVKFIPFPDVNAFNSIFIKLPVVSDVD